MIKPMNPILWTDAYKVSHPAQYPPGTQYVYSTWTPRMSRIKDVDEVVYTGGQAFFMKYLERAFNEHFFNVPFDEVMDEYKFTLQRFVGGLADYSHIEKLHKLGYLPLKIKSVPEGTRVALRCPMLTITNTHPDFFWLPNFFETLLSASLWQICTTATIADRFRSLLDQWARQTGGDLAFVDWQGHDFSFRGMSSLESACLSGAGHLFSFKGTDTIPAIGFLEDYYFADMDKELVAGSVPATEHAVMCAGGSDEGEEYETFRRLICDIYPTGIVSIVSDTWDLWNVLTNIAPALKDAIMARDGKVVFRPDSGNPADILCGNPAADPSSPAFKGVIELLWDVFGGTVTEVDFKVLDGHVGAIYGDAINFERADEISYRLAEKGFASTNVVYGCGSYGYQYQTRDTFGFAMKATHVVINGVDRNIFKDPITDDGTKKSAKGMVCVKIVDGRTVMTDCVTREEENTGDLQTVFLDGKIVRFETLETIRERLASTR